MFLWDAAARGGGGGITPEAQQFFDRVADPGDTRKAQYATMIDALVAGGVWAKLDALYVFAAADQATALENLKQDLYNATGINSPTFVVDRGFSGNAVDMHIDSGFNPSTAGGLYAQNSANMFAWDNTSAIDNVAIMALETGSSAAHIIPRYSDNTAYSRVNSVADFLSVASTDAKGLWAVSRTGAAATKMYKNGAVVDSDTFASVALVNAKIVLLRYDATYHNGQCMGGGFGAGLTDADEVALYNALFTYLTAVGGL